MKPARGIIRKFIKTMQAKVSVIIPSYNAAKYIKEAVDSALAQTYENIEVVVIDDGSTDNTKKILAPYAEKMRIKYVYESNKGLAGARNAGIKNSQGEYIAFLDADDIFLPEKVEEQVRVLEANRGYGACYSDLFHFDGAGKLYHHRYKYPSGDVFEPLLHKQFINPLTVMARRELFNKYGYFDESLRRSEDWYVWLLWARAGVKFYYLDKPLAKYRVRSAGNLSSIKSEPEMKEKNLFIFERLGKKLSEKEKERYGFEKILGLLRIKLVFAYLMVGNKTAAIKQAGNLGWFWTALVLILPATVWKYLLGFLRPIKHRLLLKRI